MVEQVVQRVLERAGQQLARKVDAEKLRIRIKELVAGYGGCSTRAPNDSTFATRQTRRVASSSVATLTAFETYPTASFGDHKHFHSPYGGDALRKKTWVSLACAMGMVAGDAHAQKVVRESFAQWQAARSLAITATQRWCVSPDAPGCELRAMADVMWLPDGGIVASDVGGPMHRFRATGEFVGALARKGRGPGE